MYREPNDGFRVWFHARVLVSSISAALFAALFRTQRPTNRGRLLRGRSVGPAMVRRLHLHHVTPRARRQYWSVPGSARSWQGQLRRCGAGRDSQGTSAALCVELGSLRSLGRACRSKGAPTRPWQRQSCCRACATRTSSVVTRFSQRLLVVGRP